MYGVRAGELEAVVVVMEAGCRVAETGREI